MGDVDKCNVIGTVRLCIHKVQLICSQYLKCNNSVTPFVSSFWTKEKYMYVVIPHLLAVRSIKITKNLCVNVFRFCLMRENVSFLIWIKSATKLFAVENPCINIRTANKYDVKYCLTISSWQFKCEDRIDNANFQDSRFSFIPPFCYSASLNIVLYCRYSYARKRWPI